MFRVNEIEYRESYYWKKFARIFSDAASGRSLNELIVSAVRGDFRRATQTRPAVERLIKLFHY